MPTDLSLALRLGEVQSADTGQERADGIDRLQRVLPLASGHGRQEKLPGVTDRARGNDFAMPA